MYNYIPLTEEDSTINTYKHHLYNIDRTVTISHTFEKIDRCLGSKMKGRLLPSTRCLTGRNKRAAGASPPSARRSRWKYKRAIELLRSMVTGLQGLWQFWSPPHTQTLTHTHTHTHKHTHTNTHTHTHTHDFLDTAYFKSFFQVLQICTLQNDLGKNCQIQQRIDISPSTIFLQIVLRSAQSAAQASKRARQNSLRWFHLLPVRRDAVMSWRLYFHLFAPVTWGVLKFNTLQACAVNRLT